MVKLTRQQIFSPLSVPLRLCEIPQKLVRAVKLPYPPDKLVGGACGKVKKEAEPREGAFPGGAWERERTRIKGTLAEPVAHECGAD
jgi:hypothetical protein